VHSRSLQVDTACRRKPTRFHASFEVMPEVWAPEQSSSSCAPCPAHTQAQAEARADALRQLASLQLRSLGQAALSADKPKLVLALCAHAPKVAMPDAAGRSTLVVDLGRFSLTSAPPAHPSQQQLEPHTQAAATGGELMSMSVWPGTSYEPPSLSAEEAAVYDVFAARLDSVAAYLVLPVQPGGLAARSTRQQHQQPTTQQQQQQQAFAWPEFIAHAQSQGSSEGSEGGGGGEAAGATAQGWDLERVLSASSSRWRLVPLLERFGVDVGMLLAKTLHPK